MIRKFGIIGFGNISTRHRSNLKELVPSCSIIGLSSSGAKIHPKPDNCDIIANSLDELISYQPELVIIASPSSHHKIHALPLLAEKIPLLIEKPLSYNSNSALDILKASQEYSTPVAVGYCLRFSPCLQRVKQLINKGSLGTLYNLHIEMGQYLPDWRPNKSYKNTVSAQKKLGGGVLLELSHEFDYVFWLIGRISPIHSILRNSRELELDVEEIADITAISDHQNIICHFHMDFLQKKAYRKLVIIAEKARLECDLINNSIALYDKKGKSILYDSPGWDKNQMYLSMLQCFIRGNKNKSKNNLATADDSYQTVKFIEKIKS